MKIFIWTFFLLITISQASSQQKAPPQKNHSDDNEWLEDLLRKNASPLLLQVLDHPDTFRYQLIYTQINRDKNNQPHFKNYYLHLDKDMYFNPASTVKLPTA
ncbi:MAG: hypothetical protein ABUT20_64985, partial [Bacteroidota bacterium]